MQNTTIKTPLVPPYEEGELGVSALEILNDYTDHLNDKNFSESTVRNRRKQAKRFLCYLENHKESYTDLSRTSIAEYWIAAGNELAHASMPALRCSLASFLIFLTSQGVLKEDLSATLPKVTGRVTRIKNVYTDDEIAQVLNAIDREGSVGKPDYAMIMLGSCLALRALDIIRLRVSDIDWKHSEMTCLQHKTKKMRTIPIPSVVGNALLDYLLNGRPESDSAYLFLSSCSPYNELSDSSMCATILGKRIAKAGLVTGGRSTGFHVFRIHAASKLLAEGISLSSISNFLGHGNPRSIKPYLSVDEKNMRECCLSFTGIEIVV